MLEPVPPPGPFHGSPIPPRILTPDQRLRVFLSSTLGELAPERQAARRAVEGLRLSPVMFEQGARPHPPRSLYRAYLQQSHVFVGIYWQRYGWVAPGETVSGLEDEYDLSGERPKLIYLKQPAPEREARLEALLSRIRDDDHASYKHFATPEELAELLQTDLALLLSEQFTSQFTSSAVALPEPDGAPRPLPLPPTSFVGREALLEELAEVLRRPEVRLLTLYGPGGIGKSRLALALAARLQPGAEARPRDGVGFVDLAGVRDPALLAATMALALGIRGTTGGSPEAALHSALEAREMLLVLDNFEHLTTAAPLLAELLQRAPRLKLLVTSRSVLRLSGEYEVLVPPMEVPSAEAPVSSWFEAPAADTPEELLRCGAVRLFVERARAVAPGFALTPDNAAAVAEICRRLDGLPLAIELAAARLRTLSPQALLARMKRRLPLLVDGPRDAPDRQRTLRDTIAWSYALLSAAEAELFRKLALFENNIALDALDAVLAPAGAPAPECGAVAEPAPDADPEADPTTEDETEGDERLELLSSLRDKSLVTRLGDDGGSRFGMLSTVREYAWELLERDPGLPALQRRHARFFLALAERAAVELKGARQEAWFRRLSQDESNLRLALQHFVERRCAAEALRLATALRPFWMARGHLDEGRAALRAALALVAAPGRASTGSPTGTPEEIPEGIPDEPPASARLRAGALAASGMLAWRQGDLAAARPLLHESLELYRRLGDRAGIAGALRVSGIVAHNAGDYPGAAALLGESVRLLRELGDEEGVANALLSLGNVALDRGDPAAVAHYRESREISERVGDLLGVAGAVDNLGVAAWYRGDDAVAERLTDEAEKLYRALDHPLGASNVLHRRGLLAYGRGELERAAGLFCASLRLRVLQGEMRGSAFVRYDLARVALARGRLDEAQRELREGLALARRLGAPVVAVLYLEGTAALLARREDNEAALRLLSAAVALRRAIGVPVAPVNRRRFTRLLSLLHGALSPSARRRAEAQGGALAAEAAYAEAAAALARPTND